MSDSDDFAAIAALTIHDVKNNLAQLAANAEKRGDHVGMQIAYQASETLSALLTYYKSESHHLDVSIEPNDPHELIADVIANLGITHTPDSSTNIRITPQLENAPGLWFYDRTLIQMVLNNVLHNALRYAKQNILIEVIAHPSMLEIRIQDDGEGYPQSVLEEKESGAVSRQGTGLGLRLARRVVALHENEGRRGEIQLSNHGGARFQLFLP